MKLFNNRGMCLGNFLVFCSRFSSITAWFSFKQVFKTDYARCSAQKMFLSLLFFVHHNVAGKAPYVYLSVSGNQSTMRESTCYIFSFNIS
jgi:hypothetical protein